MKFFTVFTIIFAVCFATLVSSLYIRTSDPDDIAEIRKKNADDAEALQAKFDTFTPETECVPDDTACIDGAFAKCATVLEDGEYKDKYQIMPCGDTLECWVLPLVLKRGTSLTCSK